MVVLLDGLRQQVVDNPTDVRDVDAHAECTRGKHKLQFAGLELLDDFDLLVRGHRPVKYADLYPFPNATPLNSFGRSFPERRST